jgi:hypothetical protein
MQRILDDYRSELLRPDTHGVAPESAGPISLGLRLASSRFPDGYEIVTYNKGTWFVHMLRELLRDPVTGSDDRFFAILRDFRERYHGQAPTTADFQNAVERHLPAWLNLTQDGKLDWLFQEWLDRTGIPKYSIEDLHIQRRGGTRVVSGVLVQSGVPEDFVMPVPLYLTNGRTRTFLDRIFADSDRTSFSVKAAAAGNNVIIDPEHTILQR